MTVYAALLRAVNVGGTKTLAMSELRSLREQVTLARSPLSYARHRNVSSRSFSTSHRRGVRSPTCASLDANSCASRDARSSFIAPMPRWLVSVKNKSPLERPVLRVCKN